MKILVINLERSTDRRNRMAQALSRLGLDFEVLRAVDGRRGEHRAVSRYDEAATLRRFGHRLNEGEVGCYASNYAAWQRAVDRATPILVMEDDLTLEPGFPAALAHAEGAIGRLGVLRLAALSERKALAEEQLDGGYRLARLEKGGMGTQCYAVSPAAARTLLDHSAVWTMPVDYFLDAFWLHGIPSYALLPYRVTHVEAAIEATDIGAREPYGPRGLSDYRRHWAKQRDWLLRKAYNIRHRRAGLQPS